MNICKVRGNVVSTIKHPDYLGLKLLIVEPIDEKGNIAGNSYLAVDVVQAGVGDTVLVMSEGNGVRQIFKKEKLPIRSLIIGVIDAVEAAAVF